MILSDFGERHASGTGIGQLMDDLTLPPEQMANMIMLGGGNPASIPEAEQTYLSCLQSLVSHPDRVREFLGTYGAPGGEAEFRQALATLLQQKYGWPVTQDNIALTNGSQNAFFLLFNLLAGEQRGKLRKILLPIVPEYIGYADVSTQQPFFVAREPALEILGERQFKYHVDFDNLPLDENIGALCLSRPTNPTGNVPTDDELSRLNDIAHSLDVPLIIDNAYGAPFPNVVHTDANLLWNDNVILTMSLSKIGLPALRTGIVIANPDIVTLLTRMNAVINLSPGSAGAAVALELVKSGEILTLSDTVIKPFYKKKAQHAVQSFETAMNGSPGYAHVAEGAFFLWLWFPDLPIRSDELYQRLKNRGVLVVPGHYFFPGLDHEWQHRYECLRVSYASSDSKVEAGMAIIADEVAKAYRGR